LRDPSLTEDASVLDLRREEPEIELLDPAEVRRLPRSAIARLPVVDPSTGLLAANGAELRFKRVVDVGTTLLAMALLSPVFLLVALAVWVTSRGPVFYVSDRVGRHGDGFKVLKFRSMYVDAEYRKAELEELNEMSGPVFKMKSDPRVTPVGRIIRKLSLDELPQLLHVLTGEMSLVGPRPAIPAEVETYDDQERQRLLVKPGITCIWQVSGRNDVDFDTWMRMDLDYIQNWTPWLDVSLLFRTVPAVVFGRGAY
jgi:lipopolysaccharide/colanic/teichoic acid biosynthesis glycosyltransferase